eukprot:scaffold621_cov191-Pinguiococcus_pyrenoidosus.AAC.2
MDYRRFHAAAQAYAQSAAMFTMAESIANETTNRSLEGILTGVAEDDLNDINVNELKENELPFASMLTEDERWDWGQRRCPCPSHVTNYAHEPHASIARFYASAGLGIAASNEIPEPLTQEEEIGCLQRFSDALNPSQKIGACACCGRRELGMKTREFNIFSSAEVMKLLRYKGTSFSEGSRPFRHIYSFDGCEFALVPEFCQGKMAWMCQSCVQQVGRHTLPANCIPRSDPGRWPCEYDVASLSFIERIAVTRRVLVSTCIKLEAQKIAGDR